MAFEPIISIRLLAQTPLGAVLEVIMLRTDGRSEKGQTLLKFNQSLSFSIEVMEPEVLVKEEINQLLKSIANAEPPDRP